MIQPFTWDPVKASANLRKHGISFEEATSVFGDAAAVILYDPKHSQSEERELIIGHSVKDRLLFIAFTEQPGGLIRIISARKATPRERKHHAESVGS